MSILSIDFGERKVGLAIADAESKVAVGLRNIDNKNRDFLIKEIRKICQEKGITKIIIGLPKALSGEDSPQTARVREFAKYVRMKLNLPVELEDERLTSKQALKSGARDLHQESARLILQTYIDKINKEK